MAEGGKRKKDKSRSELENKVIEITLKYKIESWFFGKNNEIN